MVNRKIDLPSKRALLLNEIEGPLRRKAKKSCNCLIPTLLVIVVGCTIGYFVLSNIVTEQKVHADQVVHEYDKAYYQFCDQAKSDHVASGEKESEALKNLCG